MRNRMLAYFLAVLLVGIIGGQAISAEQKEMPRKDVIHAPAVGQGLCVHNLFQTSMVLQRGKPIGIWGWAAPGETVTVSFAGRKQTAKAAKDRSWKTTFPAMKARTTPQTLTVKGKNRTLTLENILVGDVWILGGQSNMEAPIQHVEGGRIEIASANFPKIRMLTVPAQNGPEEKKGFPRLHEWSDWSGRHFRKGHWDVCSPETVRELSAIGYVFARRIHMASQVPIGVIDASRGGTTVETWTPMSVLKKIGTEEVNAKLAEWDRKIAEWDPKKDLENRIKSFHRWVKDMKKRGEKVPPNRKAPTDLRPGPAMNQNRPGNCYASTIVPIEGLAVKGVIFHQGFNNAVGNPGSAGAAMYYQIFGKMITAWRSAFNDPAMPFGIISLCTVGPPQTSDDYLEKMLDEGIYIRAAQYKTFVDFYEAGDKNIGFASSFDMHRSWYHPQKKVPVGERIAAWALATQYDMDQILWKPPMLKEMKIEDGKIILSMDTWVRAIDGGEITGFAIAGKDRQFQPAEAHWLVTGKDRHNRPKHNRKVIVITSPHVPNPIHFRYAWGRNPLANLTRHNDTDIPFATQRSDDWKMEEVPEKFVWDKSLKPQQYNRTAKYYARRELRLDDTQRRLAEAQAFIDEHKDKYEKERKNWEQEKTRRRKKAMSEKE